MSFGKKVCIWLLAIFFGGLLSAILGYYYVDPFISGMLGAALFIMIFTLGCFELRAK